MEIPMFIQRCLTYGVQIYPHQLKTILLMSERFNIPDEIMVLFDREKTEKYVKAIYLSGKEMSCDWSRGHELLKELGFVETTVRQGHRVFRSFKYA